MKLLWISNSPMVGSGYGVQTRLFLTEAVKAGHEVIAYCQFGHAGAPLTWNDILLLPMGRGDYGQEAIPEHIKHHKPDVAVVLFDIWPFDPVVLDHITAWSPVDHDPMPARVAHRLRCTKHQWAMSRFAEREMRRVGLQPHYVPHGVDVTAYRPVNRASARAAAKMPEDAFIAVMVAAHKGFPMRKSFDKVFRAWGQFVKRHPDALLYVHTDPDPNPHNNNVSLGTVAEFYGIPAANLRFTNSYKLRNGIFTEEYLNILYNSADVLVAPSMGEGFGIPVVEAQAAGCPVIVSDFTAQAELAGPGYKVPIFSDDLEWSLQNSHVARPRVSEIYMGLEWALEHKGDELLRARSREFALQYDHRHVWQTHMEPALQAAADFKANEHRFEKRGLGMFIDGRLWFPVNDDTSAAGIAVGVDKERVVHPHVFPDSVDGVKLKLRGNPKGGVERIILKEIETGYHLPDMKFQSGDVILDIGANTGVVSCYLAKKWPGVTVYAYEPMPETYGYLVENIKANGLEGRVIPHNLAVTGDGRDVRMNANLEVNAGDASIYANGTQQITVPSTTLIDIWADNDLEGVALLKIDVEGAEYEILQAGRDLLPMVGAIRGEMHTNNYLIGQGYDYHTFTGMLDEHVGDVIMQPCRIDEAA